MPPFIPRKRRLSSPLHQSPLKSMKRESLFEVLDKPREGGTLQENKIFIQGFNGPQTDSSLSDVDSSNLEGVLPSRTLKLLSDEEDEESNWEDAIVPKKAQIDPYSAAVSGDLELTLGTVATTDTATNSRNKKKGPSRIERQIRVSAHCMHVQFLLFHNLIRSGWACDKKIHEILLSQLPATTKAEVESWRIASGIGIEVHPESSQKLTRARGRDQNAKSTNNDGNQSDWGWLAEKQEEGIPNMSHGDPLIHLLNVLSAYWKKQFRVTCPGLRKQGYKSLELLEKEITSFKRDKHDPEKHGERLNGVQDFREHAKSSEGSKDVGVQLFTALIRSIGIEARLVASLQPLGFGWGKADEAAVKKRRKKDSVDTGQGEDDLFVSDACSSIQATEKTAQSQVKSSLPKVSRTIRRRGPKGGKYPTIDLTGNTSSDDNNENNDIVSQIGATSSLNQKKFDKPYDQDRSFPTYWTEVVSPISNEIIPVDPFILNPAVATNQDHMAAFESRGAKASTIKQVFAYVIAYSSDGTAKDVTTRYLRKHMWPGSTKGARLPIERVPVYNRKGKIKYYQDFDWFKTVMSGYTRTDDMRTVVDDLEDAKDLKILKRDKKEGKERVETLQSYKMSAEYVLERHLRREEAILPGSKPVKKFLAGKGDNAKEEPVYKRSQVAVCRTAESWHKEGRQIKVGEDPIKMVPVRAVTLTRKREVEEAERDGGEKLKQGMYSRDQTDWIIPPPIENGVIPKNAYGNMDCFVESMIPEGASHIPLKSTAKICKRLNIDYAEACVGFEFGMQRAVPIIIGVVVANEYEKLVIDEWKKDEEERRNREEGKREKVALAIWRKMLTGLRIMKKVREDYGDDADGNANTKEAMNPFTNMSRKTLSRQAEKSPTAVIENSQQHNEIMSRGFIANDSHKSNDISKRDGILSDDGQQSSFGEEPCSNNGGGFLIENDDKKQNQMVMHDETHIRNSLDHLKNSEELQKRHKRPKSKYRTESEIKSEGGPNEKSSTTKETRSGDFQARGPNGNDEANQGSQKFFNPSTAMTKATRRTISKRIAAKNSEKAVRSHYFAQNNDEKKANGTESSSNEGIAYQPPLKRLRARSAKNKKRKNSS